MQAGFPAGVRPIRLRPPPPKTLDAPEDKFQGPLNRPPIDLVYEDDEPQPAEEQADAQFMQY